MRTLLQIIERLALGLASLVRRRRRDRGDDGDSRENIYPLW
jgi:hypothetical protein